MTVVPSIDHDGSALRDAWTCAFDAEEPGGWGQHRHDQHQLVWTASGSALVLAGERSWVLPPSRALFVPGGVPHDVVLRRPAALHCLYVWPRACPLPWTAPTVVAVSALLRELLRSLGGAGGDGPVAAEALALVLHELGGAATADDGLPWPVDGRARAVASRLLAAPADPTPLADWAAALRVGESTLRRAFVEGTGLTFTEWRSRARLQAALPLLDAGLPVAAAAARVGYGSVNGFGAAFRRRYGTSPGARRG
ncbi:AraC-type DNA-binding protein [Klenkia marina]|uniref:AraC-type DNA-binding protein n=1 Tax=Klenkia marina TaxID=1960309 RepID=A0A1G4YXP5_9ACTN|nr:helix-turn-helix transcriptional regulator [Klenkia marina]SCX58234.1 AraC-type DNA-binding protein [Klenkia marina]